MNNFKRLKKGSKVAIVSLSSGILGENFIEHEIVLAEKRFKEFGLTPVYMPNSKKGMKFLSEHPEARAADLKTAFADDSIGAIVCAIGGNDTYKTIPYLMKDEEFINLVKTKPKIFMGFSDTTTNHLMFQKLGLNTFYGPAYLTDFAELDKEMLPYTKNSINYLFNPKKNYKIMPSEIWYDDRTDFSANAVGTARIAHKEIKGYEVLQGNYKVRGKLLGGCIDVFGSLLGLREKDDVDTDAAKQIEEKYGILPTSDDWTDKIMFLETAENEMSPEFYKTLIKEFKNRHYFDNISGLIIGKPHDEKYYNEYKQILKEELAEYNFPILMNLNFGHAAPRTILPYGVVAELDAKNKAFKLIDSTID